MATAVAGRMYYFYRCRLCHSLITRNQMREAMRTGPAICSCGGGTVGPTNPVKLEWLSLPVLKMTALQLLGRLDPAPEPSVKVPVPVGERSVVPLSANELALGQDEEDAK